MTFEEFQALQRHAAEIAKIAQDENLRDFFEERAAIFEWLAGMTRHESERQALRALHAITPQELVLAPRHPGRPQPVAGGKLGGKSTDQPATR